MTAVAFLFKFFIKDLYSAFVASKICEKAFICWFPFRKELRNISDGIVLE